MTALRDRDEVDLALLRAVAARDRQSFEALYKSYYPRLWRFISRWTRRQETVEEIINDTFWVVWKKADGFRSGSRVSTWIFGIAYRCAVNAGRQGDWAVSMEELQTDWRDESADAQKHESELWEWIHQGLRRLPPDQRLAIELFYFHGYRCEEVAQIVGCSVGAAKARIFQARTRLRLVLPRLAGEHPA